MKTVCLMNLIKECAWSLNDKTRTITALKNMFRFTAANEY